MSTGGIVSNALRHAFAAELRKLVTLPTVQGTVVITVLATPGLAWAAGQWPRRFEVGALLEDPSRTEELARDRWFD